MNQDTRYRWLFASITCLAFFLRIYQVADQPHDLYIDEVAIGWNAYSILQTGRDEYGNFFPLSFRSFEDYKLPLYIYITAASEAVWGKNAFAVRFPSVLAGTLTILFLISLIKNLLKKNKLALLAGLLLAISPWHLQFSRAGFEANLALFLFVLGTFFFTKSLIKQRVYLFFAGVLTFILSLYTYHNSRLFVPLFMLGLIYQYRKQLHFLNKKSFLLGAILTALLLAPFSFYVLSPGGFARASAESFIYSPHITQQTNLVRKTVAIADQFGKNYLTYFSFDFLFFRGDPIGRHSVHEMGMLYFWQFPLLLFSIFLFWKKQIPFDRIFFLWLIASPVAAGLGGHNPHALRALPQIIPLTYFTARSSEVVWKKIGSIGFRLLFLFCVGYFLSLYLHIYYHHYPKLNAPDWNGGYTEAITYALDHEQEYQQITFTDMFIHGHLFVYFYGDFDPLKAMQNPNRTKTFGKYAIRRSPYEMPPVKTLYFSLPSDTWGGTKIGEVKNKTGDTVFTIWEN